MSDTINVEQAAKKYLKRLAEWASHEKQQGPESDETYRRLQKARRALRECERRE